MTLLSGPNNTYYLLSGTSTPEPGGDIKFYFKVYLVSQDVATNSSYIFLESYAYLTDWVSPTATAGTSVNGGSYVSGTKTTNTGGTYLLDTQYVTIYHNADGSGSFTYRGRGTDNINGYAYISTRTISLPSIPRYANITTFNPSVTSPTSMSVSWGADASCSAVYYSINGGGSWSSSVGNGTSGSFNITGLTAGTTYSVMLKVVRADNSLETTSGAISKTTYAKNYITNASVNFNIGTDILLYISKAIASYYSKLTIEYSTNGSSYTTLRSATTIASGGTTTDSYNVSLTNDEKDTLYNAIPTTSTIYIRFSLETFDSSNNSYGSVTKVGTATVVDANPIFTNFTYADINAITLALTDDPSKIIKGYSNLRATVSTANKAVAQKGATMVTYRLVVGTQQIDVAYSGVADVNLDLNAIASNVFVIYAIDSRGNSTLKQISPATYIEYTVLARSSDSAVRTDNIDDETTLNFAGTMWSGNFGIQSNALTVSYRYRTTDSPTWINGTTGISPTLGSGSFTYSGHIAGDLGASGFTVSDSFYIETTITDKLSSLVITSILNTGEPCQAIHKNGIAIKKAYDSGNSAVLQVGGNVDIDGDYYINGVKLSAGFFGATHWWVYTEATIPTGYIKLEGQAVSRTTYANLFAIFGTFFGAGNGSTTFNLPDMRGVVPVGYNSADGDFDAIGHTGGEKTVTLSASQIPGHTHTGSIGSSGGHTHGVYTLEIKIGTGTATRACVRKDGDSSDNSGSIGNGGNGSHTHSFTSDSTGGGGSHNNLQPYKAWLWIIKY